MVGPMNLVDQARLAERRRHSQGPRTAVQKQRNTTRLSVMRILFVNGRPCFRPTIEQIQQYSLSA